MKKRPEKSGRRPRVSLRYVNVVDGGIHYLFHKRRHGLIAVEDEFSMKWKARKKAEFLSSAFAIWRDMGGFEGAADAVKTAQ